MILSFGNDILVPMMTIARLDIGKNMFFLKGGVILFCSEAPKKVQF